MRKHYSLAAAIFLLALLSNESFARPERVNQIPNGTKYMCANCHVNPAGGGARNPFGQRVESSFLSNGVVQWQAALANLDSDGDGKTNGEELQDPTGAWRIGQPQPGNLNLVTIPGDPNSVSAGDLPAFPFALSPAFPNPGPGEVFFNVESGLAGLADVIIYNYSGAKIAQLSGIYVNAGRTTIAWDGRDLRGAPAPGGSYIVSVMFNGKSSTIYATIYR